jgi:hypothetical protein
MNRNTFSDQLKLVYVDYVSYLHGIKTYDYKNFKLDVIHKKEIILELIDYIKSGGELNNTFRYIDTSCNYSYFKWIECDDYKELIYLLYDLYRSYSELYAYNLV